MMHFKCLTIFDKGNPFRTSGKNWRTLQDVTKIFHTQKRLINSVNNDVTYVMVNAERSLSCKRYSYVLQLVLQNNCFTIKKQSKSESGIIFPQAFLKLFPKFNRRSITEPYFELSETSMMELFRKNS